MINERNKLRKNEEVMPKGYTFEELFELMIKEDIFLTEPFSLLELQNIGERIRIVEENRLQALKDAEEMRV